VNTEEKYNSLQKILKKLARHISGGLDKVIVAYSGGVDSTFLLKAAVETLGAEKVLACIAQGPSLPQDQYLQAVKTAKDMGIEVRTIKPNELADAAFTANKADRCFICKSHLYKMLAGIAEKEKFGVCLCGCNFDDKKDFRPGNKAGEVFGVRSPLMEAGLTKEDIRKLSRKMGLATADIPASPCLASRIAYGLEITEERLRQVEAAEEVIRELGLVEFRVRHHDKLARIEVHQEDFEMVLANRAQIVEKLQELGFKFVTIDLQGFRSGSLNELLTEKEKKKHWRRSSEQ
jgi:uncharacterized protein